MIPGIVTKQQSAFGDTIIQTYELVRRFQHAINDHGLQLQNLSDKLKYKQTAEEHKNAAELRVLNFMRTLSTADKSIFGIGEQVAS